MSVSLNATPRNANPPRFAQSETLRDGEETSEGRSEHPVYLKTSQEILQMEDENIIGFYSKYLPFEAKRINWLLNPVFIARKKLQPVPLQPLPPLAEIDIADPGQDPKPAAFTYISLNGL